MVLHLLAGILYRVVLIAVSYSINYTVLCSKIQFSTYYTELHYTGTIQYPLSIIQASMNDFMAESISMVG